MKLKLKMVAAAVALASLAGVAHADLTSGTVQNNGSFSLMAYNTVTFDWYMRDLGYLINTFLPTGITTSVADNNQGGAGPNPGAVGDKSPEEGLLLNAGNTTNFSDPAFATWLGTQTASDVVWMVGAYDLSQNSGSQNYRRLIASSTNSSEDFTNGQIDAFTATSGWGGLFNFFNPGTLSKTGTSMNPAALTGFQSGVSQAGVGQSANLFYSVRSNFTTTGSGQAAMANTTAFGNTAGLATVTLQADGDFIYNLAPAAVAPVPLPPALWMMGAGLMAIGGMVRRRRAAALES